MGRRVMAVAMLAVFAAASLAAQDFKAGDLMPRNGIIAYLASDKPDVFYRLFGKDENGEYRLRGMLEKKSAGKSDPEAAAMEKAATDLFMGVYDRTASFEMGFLDVGLGGAKFILHLRAKAGQSYDLKSPVMDKLFKEEKTISGFKVRVYKMPEGKKQMPGLDQYYIVAVNDGLVVSNFETTITDSLARLASKDFSEALSSRAEFSAWRDSRTQHDISLFIIGRELQAAIERMLPSKEQAKRDLPGAYSALDEWLQLREYKSIVVDFDYDEAKGGIDLQFNLTTQRKTKLLERLSIAPAEFKYLSLLPANTTFVGGLQLGDAPTTFENLVAFARDAEKAAKLAKPEGVVPMPKDEKGEPPAKAPDKSIDATLAKFDEGLGAMGTSVKEIVGTLGSEVIVFTVGDQEYAKTHAASRPDEMIKAGRFGMIVGLKDAKAAQAIVDRVREKDVQGMGKMTVTEYAGVKIYSTPEGHAGFAYAFSGDVLLFDFTQSDEMSASLITDLKSMIDGRTKAREFVSPGSCSKFLTVRLGELAAISKISAMAAAQAFTREAKPIMGNEWFEFVKNTTVTLRLVEGKESLGIGLKIVGLPPIGSMVAGMKGSGKDGAEDLGASWSFTQSNGRELARGLRRYASENDKTPLSLDAAVKGAYLRTGNLQTPFDKRWKGSTAKLKYVSLGSLKRDKDGKLPPWVDAEAAQIIEDNEKAGWVSFTLAEGAADTIKGYKAGVISAYQSSPDTFGGRIVVYGDDETGWLSETAFQKALDANKKGDAVPSSRPADKPRDPKEWPEKDNDPKGTKEGTKEGSKDSKGNGKDDPWGPGK